MEILISREGEVYGMKVKDQTGRASLHKAFFQVSSCLEPGLVFSNDSSHVDAFQTFPACFKRQLDVQYSMMSDAP